MDSELASGLPGNPGQFYLWQAKGQVGTFKLRGSETVHQTLEAAIKTGYRSIDTAAVYRNEEDIRKSLDTLMPKYGLKREELFITSKLSPRDHGSGRCRAACLASLERLGLDYLDLYLIHWPGAAKVQPEDPRNRQLRAESSKDMEQLLSEGKLKAIGVSNYTKNHLLDLLENCDIKPGVLQNECHPHLTQEDLVKFCRDEDIHFQAYSSLGSSTEEMVLLHDHTVVSIADKYERTPAQVLLRWAVQQGIGVIPKSTNPTHIEANMEAVNFEHSETDMKTLSGLNCSKHYCWNPDKVT